MKKAVSVLLTIAMCMGMLVAIVPTVSATEPDPTPSGAVYYEENFNDPAYATLVDSDLAAAIGWSAPNQYQTMLIQDGKLRIVAQATDTGDKSTATKFANEQTYTVASDERISKGATVIEYKFTYQARPAGSADVVVTRASDSVTKTIKADGQCWQHYAAFCSVGDTDNLWQGAPLRPTGTFDIGAFMKLGGSWVGSTYFYSKDEVSALEGRDNHTGTGPIYETVDRGSQHYEYYDTATSGTEYDGGSIMGRENSVKIVVDPDISGINVWFNGVLLTQMKRDASQPNTWITSAAAAAISDVIGFHVKPGVDVLIDDVRIYGYVPELVISELATYAKEAADSYGSQQNYYIQWAEVTNTSDYNINVFDYALFEDHSPVSSATNGLYKEAFTATSAKRDIAYLYPGEHTFGGYNRTYTNPAYAEGVLQPGESAMIVIPWNNIGSSATAGVSMKMVKELEVYHWGQTAGSEIKTFFASSDNNFKIQEGGGWTLCGVTKVTNTGSDNAANYTPVAEMTKGTNGQLGNLISAVMINGSSAGASCWGISSKSERLPMNTKAYTKSIEFSYWNAEGGSQVCGQLKYDTGANRGTRNTTHSLGEVPADCRRNICVTVEGVNGAKTYYNGVWGVAFDIPAASAVPDYRFENYTFNASTVTSIAAEDMTASEVVVTAVYKTVRPTYVGYQTSAVTDGKYSVRFVASINYLDNVASVGFIIRAQYTKDAAPVDKTVTQYCSYVYTSILAAGVPVTAESLGGNYVYALHIDNIPENVGEITFTVTPYYRVGDSDVIESVAQTVVVGG
ncbi:MAG: hypothetical protein J5885_04115 [Clostridia bacterium]|nr:hypothetical protein [Clostridia bacterium]